MSEEVNENNEPTVEINGQSYKTSDLSEKVQQLLAVHAQWSQEADVALAKLNNEANKASAAVKQVEHQIVAQLNADNEAATEGSTN